jgi:hypothetical protein
MRTVIRSFSFPTLTGGSGAVAQQNGVGDMHDADAIVTSRATATSQAVISGVALNGVIGAASVAPWRGLTVTTSSSVGAYTTAADIVAVVQLDLHGGTYEYSITARLTQVNGNETLDFSGPFQRVVSITIPAQANTAGAFTFGVGDIYSNRRSDANVHGDDFQHVMGLATGNIKVAYPGGQIDVLKTVEGRLHPVTPAKIFRSGTTAAFSVGV